MESEAADTLDFVVSQTWKCLSVPATGKNSVLSTVFFDEEILFEIASAANITFCPGLLDVVQAPSPPDVGFFKSLPVKYLGLWAIYSLVLEKPGCIPVVYTGEASNARFSVPDRWKVYNKPDTYAKLVPSKVAEALDAGYKITHKGVLAWYSIPSAKDVPRFRVLNYCMEAMFSFYFWTMYSKTKDYQISSCCPWPRESFTYGGLCSHSALNDPIHGRFDLSDDQLEMLAAQDKELRRLRARRDSQADKARRKAADPEGFKAEQKHQRERRKAEDPEGVKEYHSEYYQRRKVEAPAKLAAQARKADLRYRKASHGKSVARGQAFTARRKAAKTFFCDICDVPCDKASALTRHNRSTKHKNRVAKLAAGVTFSVRCDICDKGFENKKVLAIHIKGDRHKEKEAALTPSI